MNPFDYVPATVPDDCVLKISPSSFANFIERPHHWYRTQILGEDVFDYNSMSVIGTIVHYCAEQVAKGDEVDEEAIEAFIASKEPKDDYDPERVRKGWYPIALALINGYVTESMPNYLPVEEQHCADLGEGIYAAGTTDVLQGTKEDCMIVDYKTYSSKTKPKSILKHYFYQLMVYAWILRKNGYNVTRVRNVYVNEHIDGGISEKTRKPLKSYPPEVVVLTQEVTEEDFAFIESMLELCKETYRASEAHPELLHVIYHDPRLKA